MTARTRGVFVTGTDTGVGKTYVGTALIPRLVAQGIKVIPRKPAESGCELIGRELFASDAASLHAAAGHPGALEQVCPYRLRQAVSPARAARLKGLELTIADLEAASLSGADTDSFLWVEGAGGFYSPLASDGLNADLAVRLGLPVLLVAADRLGCINHVLLTVEAIRTRGLEASAVILNQTTAHSATDMNNAEDLGKWLKCPLIEVTYGEATRQPQLFELIRQLIW